MTPTWQLRRAASADLDAIMALETTIFVTDSWSRDTMRHELASPHSYYLVATPPDAPDEIDGYAGLRAPSASRQGDIQTLAVTDRARGHGLGRALMNALIREARERGVGELFLDVRTDNDVARRLYRSLGFGEIGIRPGYYQPDNVDAVVMSMPVPAARTGLAAGAETLPISDRDAG